MRVWSDAQRAEAGERMRKGKTANMVKTEPKPNGRAEAARTAANARWQAVKDDRAQFVEPFHSLPIDGALSYLTDLRAIVEEGGNIVNHRINSDKHIKCAGPRCGKSLEGDGPNGRPKWVSKIDVRDHNNPAGADRKEHFRSFYFCSELHYNEFMRLHGGAMGAESKK